MPNDQTPEQVARAALASLKGSVSLTGSASTSRQRTNQHQEPTGKASSSASGLMGALWAMMTDLYGHKWTNVHGERDESGNWGKALAGITGQQMGDAMKVLVRSGDAWPPSAPEFRALCESCGAGLGIPAPDAAWREAVEASTDPAIWKFSHPIVQEAARLTDWYSIRHGIPKAETVQARFAKRYQDLTAKLQRGEQLVSNQVLLTQEQTAGQYENAVKASEALAQQIAKDQGLTKQTPAELRAALLAKMGIRR